MEGLKAQGRGNADEDFSTIHSDQGRDTIRALSQQTDNLLAIICLLQNQFEAVKIRVKEQSSWSWRCDTCMASNPPKEGSSQKFTSTSAGTLILGPPVSVGWKSGENQSYDPHDDLSTSLLESLDLTTGDEGEEVIFKARGKLFRYNNNIKAWQEGSVGEVKILKNLEIGRARLLMKTEKIHQICVNHWLKPDMQLLPISSSDCAWVWDAIDFAKGEKSHEKFSLEFKTPNLAAEFKKTFDNMKQWKEKSFERAEPIKARQLNLLKDKSFGHNVISTNSYGLRKKLGYMKEDDLDDVLDDSDDDSDENQTQRQERSSLAGSAFEIPTEKPRSHIMKSPTPASQSSASHLASTKPRVTQPSVMGNQPGSNLLTVPRPIVTSVSTAKPSSHLIKSPTPASQSLASHVASTKPRVTQPSVMGNQPGSNLLTVPRPIVTSVSTTKPSFHLIKSPTPASQSLASHVASTKPRVTQPSVMGNQPGSNLLTVPRPIVTSVSTAKPSSHLIKSPTPASQSLASHLASTKPTVTTQSLPASQSLASHLASTKPTVTTQSIPASQSLASHLASTKPTATTQSPFAGFSFNKAPGTSSSFASSQTFRIPKSTAPVTTTSASSLFVGFSFQTTPSKKDTPALFGSNTSSQSSKDSSAAQQYPQLTALLVGGPNEEEEGTAESPRPGFCAPSQSSETSQRKLGQSPMAVKSSLSQKKEDKPNTTTLKDTSTKPFQFAGAGAPVFGSTQQDNVNVAEDQEYDPHYDPIISLPENIDLTTGNEGQEVVFKERAKLYRYDSDTQAWKERGVGDMKILVNPETGKARLLMRREQVLKVCASHWLKPDMQLLPMSSSDRAFVWNAIDFAEGEECHQQFALKFKALELAAEFKKTFDEMKEGVKPSLTKPVEPVKEKPAEPVEEVKPAASKREDGSGHSFHQADPVVTHPEEEEAEAEDDYDKYDGEYQGEEDGYEEDYYEDEDDDDEYEDYPEESSLAGSAFEITTEKPSSHVIKSPTPASQSSASHVASTKPRVTQPSVMGNQPGSNLLTVPRPILTSVSTAKPCSHLIKSPTPASQSLASHLASTKPTVTTQSPFAGFSFNKAPGTSSSFASSQTFQILKSTALVTTTSASSPFAGFSFQTTPSKKDTPALFGSNTSSQSSKDSSAAQQYPQLTALLVGGPNEEEEGTAESPRPGFCAPSQSSETSQRKLGQSPMGVTSSLSQKKEDKPNTTTLKGKNNNYDDDVIFMGEVKATPEQVAKAEKLMLPPNFYLYEQRPPCPGCRGCDEEDLKAKKDINKPIVVDEKSSSLFPEEPKVSEAASQPLSFFGNAAISSLSFASMSADGDASFAKKDTSTKPFQFAGAGVPVFGSTQQDNVNVAEDQEYDPHYDPIISLPENIDLTTGDEGQEVVFKERAKLYRYDSDTQAWKERGVGDMKILVNPETGKARILMRREQVLKVCASHWLKPDMQLLPMSSSDHAFVWNAIDFAEGEECHQQFALRFKAPELAAEFKKTFDEMKEGIKPSLTKPVEPVKEKPAEPVEEVKPAASKGEDGSGHRFHQADPVVSHPEEEEAEDDYDKYDGEYEGEEDGYEEDYYEDDDDEYEDYPEEHHLADQFKRTAGSWDCDTCMVNNPADKNQCLACSTAKPGATSKPSKGSSETQPSLSEMFKPASAFWDCNSCMINNPADKVQCMACSTPKPGSSQPSQGTSRDSRGTPGGMGMPSLADQFKPAPGSWNCDTCMINNPADKYQCLACSTAKPGATAQSKKGSSETQPSLSEMFKPASGSWDCNSCMINNPADKVQCMACSTPKPGSSQPSQGTSRDSRGTPGGMGMSGGAFSLGNFKFSGFSSNPSAFSAGSGFGSSGFNKATLGTFLFGQTLSQSSNTTPSSSAGFSFPPRGFSFTQPKPETSKPSDSGGSKMPTTSSFPFTAPTPPNSESTKSAADSPTKEQPLSKQTEAASGQQTITPKCSFGSGVPQFTIGGTNQQKPSSGILFVSNSKRSSPIELTLDQPVKAVDKEKGTKKSGGAFLGNFKFSGFSSNPSAFSAGSGSGSSGFNKSTPGTFLFGKTLPQSSNTTHSSSAGFSLPPAGFSFTQPKPETSQPSDSGGFKVPVASSFSFTAPTPHDPEYTKSASPSTTREQPLSKPTEGVPGQQMITAPKFNFGSLMPQFTFGVINQEEPSSRILFVSTSGSSAPTSQVAGTPSYSTTNQPGCVFGETQTTPVFGAASEKGSTSAFKGFEFGTKQSEPKTEQKEAILFSDFVKNQGEFSFSVNVDNATSSPLKSGAKSLVKSLRLNKTGEYDQEEQRDDIYFEPVVTLPENYKLETGEENEEVKFSQRAKLYRFDVEGSQWKERGVGDIKVLYNPETKKYRIVMRREQVMTVCANHYITQHVNLQPNKGSERSWVWQAMDSSDGHPQNEQLAVRFKTEDEAREFKEVVDEAERNLPVTSDQPVEPVGKAEIKKELCLEDYDANRRTHDTTGTGIHGMEVSQSNYQTTGLFGQTLTTATQQSKPLFCGARADEETAEEKKEENSSLEVKFSAPADLSYADENKDWHLRGKGQFQILFDKENKIT